MGIDNRDYMRDRYRQRQGLGRSATIRMRARVASRGDIPEGRRRCLTTMFPTPSGSIGSIPGLMGCCSAPPTAALHSTPSTLDHRRLRNGGRGSDNGRAGRAAKHERESLLGSPDLQTTWQTLRSRNPALLIGIGKAVSGSFAMLLTLVALSL